MPDPPELLPRGRGSKIDPPNRFGGTYHELDLEQVADDADFLESLRHRATEYLPDRSRTIVAENESPEGYNQKSLTGG